MSKIAFLGDLHFGARNAHEPLHNYMRKFFKDFFEYVDEHDIKVVVQVGDMFDVRKYINVQVIYWFREMFLDEVSKRGLNLYVLAGNHDIYYKESVKVNSLHALLKDYQIVYPILTIIDEPTTISINSTEYFFVPWVCKENEAAVSKAIKKTKAKYCVGHFEFNGFEMQKGQMMESRWDHKEYRKFDLVISGHYHHKSTKDNVLYTGTPYELTWMDYQDEKGFWVQEPDGEINFVPNHHTLHDKIHYAEGVEVSKSQIEGKYIHVLLNDRVDKKKFNQFMDNLALLGPLDVKIKEAYTEVLSEEEVNMDAKDTDEALREYVESSTIDLDKTRMVGVMNELYREAIAK